MKDENLPIIELLKACFNSLIIKFEVPSAVLSAIFPVKPSVIMTFDSPSIILFPSIYPLNIKLFSLLRLVNFLKVFFSVSVPLISSDPILRSDTNGFLFGKGPGKGHVKNDLYSAQSDFIYASSIEEFGSIFGGLGLVIMYTILFFRSIRIMNKTESLFGAYVVFGLSFLLVFQSLINMGVGVNLFPVTGQPLPLISMGGTSIIFSCVALGIIINVSRTVYKDA